MTPSQRIIKLVAGLGIEVPPDTRSYRIRAGRGDRSAGAWSWGLMSHSHPEFSLGSQWPMSIILQAPKVVHSINDYGQISLDPCPFPKWTKWDAKGKRKPIWDTNEVKGN